jgi:hypothetical protein
LGGVKLKGNRGNLIVTYIIVLNLPAGRAANDMGTRKHRADFIVASAVGQNFPGTEIEHETGRILGRILPAVRSLPRKFLNPHQAILQSEQCAPDDGASNGSSNADCPEGSLTGVHGIRVNLHREIGPNCLRSVRVPYAP